MPASAAAAADEILDATEVAETDAVGGMLDQTKRAQDKREADKEVLVDLSRGPPKYGETISKFITTKRVRGHAWRCRLVRALAQELYPQDVCTTTATRGLIPHDRHV